tara:strand:- start:6937 stop:7203 length:267 start_codon:yes stop_codon:yes gene_type:complete
MTSNEFVFWLKGIVVSNTLIPTKATWDLISETIQQVKLNKKENAPLDGAVIRRMTDPHFPGTTSPPNPYEVKCQSHPPDEVNNSKTHK